MKYYNEYVQILKEELKPAMGCTEPIAISYAAALAKKYLKEEPTLMDIYVSGNILKNVKFYGIIQKVRKIADYMILI